MKNPLSGMTMRMLLTVIAAVLLAACSENASNSEGGPSASSAQVTIGTLLTEMVDRDAVARYPDPVYTSASFSSYDRASLSKDQDWFANGDNNWFLRRETVKNREEFVLFDADGPGAITRWWMTFAGAFGGSGYIRIYIDNAEEPVVADTPFNIVSGDKVAMSPIASSISKLTPIEQRGHNLFYPIPYSKHCKITYCSHHIQPDADERHIAGDECIYYNIEYRTYRNGTTVESYSVENAEKYKALEAAAAAALNNPANIEEAPETVLDCTLNAGESREFKFDGPGAIREVAMLLGAGDINQALRSTVLEISFDGESTVFIPVGEFFGVGYKPMYTNMWYVEASEGGMMKARWTMPFGKEARLTLKNYGAQPVTISNSRVKVSEWNWDKRSMYFHAMWKFYPTLDTRKNPVTGESCEHYDINFVTLDGKGVYMGDSMTIFDLSSGWWGEGDEKVYVDDADFPSFFGTGSEDYYGYAWCHPNTIVDHPFTSQPSGVGNLAPGYTFNSRHRSLDRICFADKLVFDMEIWHWQPSTMDLGVSTYFYLLPGGKVSNERDLTGLTAKPVLDPMDFVDLSEEKMDIEAEFLKLESTTGGNYEAQTAFGENWSNGAQVFWSNAPVGAEMVLSFNSPYEGDYSLRMLYAFSWDYGSFDIWFNDMKIENGRNFNNATIKTEWSDYGTVHVVKGKNTIKVKATAHNPAYALCFFGLDRVVLEKQ